ncbi:YicC/YloC family endoribonuclease [Desulfurispira natronophila]|uniref:Uncharacterized protein (TIGR00255 family) n=1 Tax=Desulfurispira natronophila TaxID=682562 RepID=A0A7W7Y2U9_9BACT|nr:YicC/YloC family endoribonuclease [Desulfurispira natronophila]MBB5021019.1 uncharacterized protein (TIGR00255 family) [Desulfurispira natronophila]
MLNSMTGFGSGSYTNKVFDISCEIKSLNNRFFECLLRTKCPPLGEFEQQIKNRIRQQIQRGRLEVFIKATFNDSSAHTVTLNRALTDEYYKSFTEILDRYGLDRNVKLDNFLTLENILEREERIPDRSAFEAGILDAVDTALERLGQMRRHEGKSLEDDILFRLDVCEGKITDIDAQATSVPAALTEKLRSRISRLLESTGSTVEVDENRIAQEAAILADKSDVTEEIIRFNSHLQQFREYMKRSGAVGRSMEFILQEMQREINTIASKSPDSRTSRLSVEVRSELEKIREQVQNVE